jgi:O-antigen ligase
MESGGSAGEAAGRTWSPGALLVGLALPVLFLHARYQPAVDLHLGSTTATAYLSDLAVWLVALGALLSGVREGFGRLRAGLPIWWTGGLLLAWIAVSLGYGATRSGYALHTHAVTAAKWGEYALLAVSLPLLLRRRDDLRPVLAILAVWTAVAAAVGVVQFFGASFLHAWPAGRRQPSFLGQSDLASLGAMSFSAGLCGLVLGDRRRDRGWIAALLAGGGLAVILSGSSAGLIGVVAAAVAVAALAIARGRLYLRPAAVGCAAVALCGVGVLALRGNDYAQFLRFLGIAQREQSTSENVQTYSQRTLLVYIGTRIFLDHPLAGVGFQGSDDFAAYGPELAAAHRRFPHIAPIAFPARTRSYGVQNLYVQTLADLGAVGAVLLVSLLAAGLLVGSRAALADEAAGAVAVAWLLAAMALWAAQGFVAGIPLDAHTWLALGLAAAAASWRVQRAWS